MSCASCGGPDGACDVKEYVCQFALKESISDRDRYKAELEAAKRQLGVLGEIIRRNVPQHHPSTANVSESYQIAMGGKDYMRLLEFVNGMPFKDAEKQNDVPLLGPSSECVCPNPCYWHG
jgi:hypothetical protein